MTETELKLIASAAISGDLPVDVLSNISHDHGGNCRPLGQQPCMKCPASMARVSGCATILADQQDFIGNLARVVHAGRAGRHSRRNEAAGALMPFS